MIRCKFMLSEVKESHYGYSSSEGYKVQPPNGKTLVFNAVYDPKLIEEDKGYAKATPSGRVEFQCDNPKALEYFKPGHQYYFDITIASE